MLMARYDPAILARLAAHGIAYRERVQDDNPPSLPPELVAAALGRMDPWAATYARVRYLDETRQRVVLGWMTYYRAVRGRFPAQVPDEQLRALGDMAVDEAIGEHRCRVCRGVGYLILQHRPVVCTECGGATRIPWTQELRAARMGVSTRTWRRRYRDGYATVLQAVDALDDEIRAVLRRELAS